MEKICQNCAYWSRDRDNKTGDCNLEGTGEKDDVVFEVEVHADDDQGLFHVLKTGYNFGCNQFLNRK